MRLLIVNFHYIRDEKPSAGIFPVSTSEFRRQIEILGRMYHFISQQELIDMIESDMLLDKDCCLITFDDGLREQLQAIDILRSLSIPAVCFVTTQPIIDERSHDVHKMHHVYSRMNDDQLYGQLNHLYRIAEFNFDDFLLHQEYRYDTLTKKKIKFFINFVLDEFERDKLVNNLFSELEPNEDIFRQRLYMDAHDLAKLSAAGMLGTHAKSHKPLSKLDLDALHDEIHGSKNILEALTGCPIRSISYPFGGVAAVTAREAEVASTAGMVFGLTMMRGINTDEDIRRGKMLLRRVDTNDAPGGKLNSREYEL